MANIDHGKNNLPRDPYRGADEALLGFGAIAALVVVAISLSSVFAASVVAGGGALSAIGVFILLFVTIVRSEQRPRLPLVLLALGAAWIALSGFIIFENHWLAFTPAAWVMNGLFIAALASGAWARLTAWVKLLAALTAASLVAATILLPRPPGGEGAGDTAEKWTIKVDVTDSADNAPLEGAHVLCGTIMQWDNALAIEDTSARTTDRDGRVDAWEFDEDPRLKIVVCNVWKDADDGNAGYPVATQSVPAPAGGGEYQLHFALQETPHPDVAYLAVDLTGSYASANWFYLTFEVWEGEPQGYVGSKEGPQPLARKTYAELKGGFRLENAQAASGLTLRYRYEGPASGDGLSPPYEEVQSVPIEPVTAGARRRIALKMPSNQGHD